LGLRRELALAAKQPQRAAEAAVDALFPEHDELIAGLLFESGWEERQAHAEPLGRLLSRVPEPERVRLADALGFMAERRGSVTLRFDLPGTDRKPVALRVAFEDR
jgi:hypothetical protein